MKVVYWIPVSLLHQAAKALQPPEKACFVTGIKLGKQIIVLTQIIPVAGEQSRTHVEPNPASVLNIQQKLWGMGQDIEAQFHSHPGSSKEATHPSHIDIATARRWETGEPFLGGIFSEGGRFVRFFNHKQKSEVIVYGNSQEIESGVFELSQASGSPVPPQEEIPLRLVNDRPPREVLMVESGYYQPGWGLVNWCGGSGQQPRQDLRPNGTVAAFLRGWRPGRRLKPQPADVHR